MNQLDLDAHGNRLCRRRMRGEIIPGERRKRSQEESGRPYESVAGGCGLARRLPEFGERLCRTVAGGNGLARVLREFGETPCRTVAGGCGPARDAGVFGEALHEERRSCGASLGRIELLEGGLSSFQDVTDPEARRREERGEGL